MDEDVSQLWDEDDQRQDGAWPGESPVYGYKLTSLPTSLP